MTGLAYSLLTAAAAVGFVNAQSNSTATRAPTSSRTSSAGGASSTTPLAAKSFTYPDLPYRVDTDDGPRGRQQGYNLCNSTTEGQESMCQTSFINSIDDFCLWGPPEPNSVVGNTEGEMVAWCTKPGKGTRLIPPGALKGVQFVKSPSYVQVVGYIDQTLINIQAGDYGGEMDPHGADRRGNPLGGLLFSNAFGNSTNGTVITQAVEWHNFMGGDMFCLKACDPSDQNDYRFCEHIFDRIGCRYNAPADYNNINGTFQSCLSDNQLYPGVYVEDGQTRTYTQPPESLGAISTIPYEPVIPSSSQCSSFDSLSLYASLNNVSTSAVATTSLAAGATTSAAAAAAATTTATGASILPVTSAAGAGGAVNNNAAVPTSATTGSASISTSSIKGSAAVAALLAVIGTGAFLL